MNHGIYGDSQFYKAKGEFHIFNTCNKWTAKGLESAGMNISTTFKLTASSIMCLLVSQKHSADIMSIHDLVEASKGTGKGAKQQPWTEPLWAYTEETKRNKLEQQ